MFHRTLLEPQLSPHCSAPFPALASGSSTTPSLLYRSASPSTATLHGGLCFGRLAEQCPLAGHEPKSLIKVSSEHTPIILLSRRGSLDTNVDDLATAVDASETHDTTDAGRLTSPLFSQVREVSAIPLMFLVLRHFQAWRDPRGALIRFRRLETVVEKQRNRELESVQDFQRERERILSGQRDPQLEADGRHVREIGEEVGLERSNAAERLCVVTDQNSE